MPTTHCDEVPMSSWLKNSGNKLFSEWHQFRVAKIGHCAREVKMPCSLVVHAWKKLRQRFLQFANDPKDIHDISVRNCEGKMLNKWKKKTSDPPS